MEVQDPQDIVNYFDSIGIVCKVAPKRKPIRAAMCWAASVYLPLDYNINENKTRNNMKRTIRLKESELRRMISESVRRTLNEDYNENYVEDAINELTNKCTEMVLKVKWGDDINNQDAEIDRKILLKSFYSIIHSIM